MVVVPHQCEEASMIGARPLTLEPARCLTARHHLNRLLAHWDRPFADFDEAKNLRAEEKKVGASRCSSLSSTRK
jgi:hypothetical protein